MEEWWILGIVDTFKNLPNIRHIYFLCHAPGKTGKETGS